MANISETIREARLRWLGRVKRNTEDDVVGLPNEKIKDESGWARKDRKTESEVE